MPRARAQQPATQDQKSNETFRFKTGVELINVTATVTDGSGHFVSGLRKEDFRLYQDDQLQQITHFNSERVPVSLGIVLDTSGSMDGEKMMAARQALNRFLLELLGPDDEVFLYRFDNNPELVHGWTTDKRRVSDELSRLRPRGGTAMYDAVAEAVPMVQSGKHRKKALVIISDGNDTSSRTAVVALQEQIRETEILVYAIGIDSQNTFQPRSGWGDPGKPAAATSASVPVPDPGPEAVTAADQPGRHTLPRQPSADRDSAVRSAYTRGGVGEGVNVAALRDITDDSGGRTEVIRSPRDLEPATAYIADELSKQYYLGYAASGSKDGRWHSIRVEVDRAYTVRARKGFIATP